MLILLFLHYLVHGVSIDGSPIQSIDNRSLAGNHCTDLSHCRTIWNIIWSCLVTIFSCTWVAVHPNIPCPKEREANSWIERCILNPLLSFAEHRLPLFICALLVPEYILAWAIRQFLRAREIAKREFELLVKILSIVINNSYLERGWSTTHGFFIIMGGFHLFEHGSKETSNDDKFILHKDDTLLHPLTARDLYNYGLRLNGTTMRTDIDFSSFRVPTEAEIKDRGKSDWLAKSLVLLQTSWFVMQCIARAHKHLPVTHLEIVTLAYAVMNFVVYIFWWNKPLNVSQPVRVFRKSEAGEMLHNEPTSEAWELTWEAIGKGLQTILGFIAGLQDGGNLSSEDRVPRFWSDDQSGDFIIADLIVLGVGVCFGVIHCIAWDFSFPTHTELLIWRISSITITAVPIYIPLMLGLCLLLFNMEFEKSSITVVYFGPLTGGILYILARVVTLVLAFTSLRDLPRGAYETVHWTTFIPHI